MRVVAIQPDVPIGEVERSLDHLEDLIGQAAREHAPEAIFLPESMTTKNVYDRRMRHVARPIDGAPLQMLQRAARAHDCVVGGGFIAIRGNDTRGTYAVVEPDGTARFHDKDQPSFWENNYYSGGDDDGVMDTSLGTIGVANGFEWGRTRTARRMLGRVRLLAGGMHFPSFPTWKATKPWFWDRDHFALVQYARETPPRMARLLGVPAVHPSHVGDFVMETMLVPGLAWPSLCVGETAICDADGVVLDRLSYDDGEGWICADVDMAAEPRPRDPMPPGFWNSLLPISVHAVWQVGNVHGRVKYEGMKRLRMHSWQR
jgi:predicted amidohydrolase